MNIELSNKTILVTGGAGFIGSNLCEALLEKGNKVVCLDNFATGKSENIAQLLKDTNFTLIEGDIRKTLPEFVASRVSKKSPDTLFCRLIYIDTSAYEPSILGLDLLWKHIVPGGLVIIDQRTQGGEWRAAIEFCEKNNIKPKSINAFNSAPIYLKKE